jgi:hypothetical protein
MAESNHDAKPWHKSTPTRAFNAVGKFYVDGRSMQCGTCPILAPANCRMNEARQTCEVFKQPASKKEEAQLRKAMAHSCVQCINDDGDDEWGQPPCEVMHKGA